MSKKIISAFFAIFFALSLTACQNTSDEYPFEEVCRMAEKEIPQIGMMLGDNWDKDNLPEHMFLLIANTQYLYARDNGVAMPTVEVGENDYLASDGIKIDVLIPAIQKYYPFDTDTLQNVFKESVLYDEAADAVILADGWGWMLDAKAEAVTDNKDGTYDVSYNMYTPEGTVEFKGVVKAKVHPDGYLQFLSNVRSDAE